MLLEITKEQAELLTTNGEGKRVITKYYFETDPKVAVKFKAKKKAPKRFVTNDNTLLMLSNGYEPRPGTDTKKVWQRVVAYFADNGGKPITRGTLIKKLQNNHVLPKDTRQVYSACLSHLLREGALVITEK